MQLSVAAAEVELASDSLWAAGPSAVLEADLGDGRVRLTADVVDPSLITGPWAPSVVVVDDDGYLDAWRSWAAPVRAGRRVVVRPAWLDAADAADAGPGTEEDLVVVLDPGRAFGSGSHESTRLAIALLEAAVRPQDRVLDVGCGSGVLSVTACLLGAAHVTAIDVEAAAVDATLANAATNGVADRIEASVATVDEVGGGYDVVVANIGGPALVGMAAELQRRVRAPGTLVLSGRLVEQVGALVEACDACEEGGRIEEAGWGAVWLRRPAISPGDAAR